MFPYIVTFFIPALIAMLQPVGRPWKSFKVWILVIIYFIIYIGLRHWVGSDWINYDNMFNIEAVRMNYRDALKHDDPLFWLVMVWVKEMGWSIHIVNLVSSAFFVVGLVVFARRMPNPWLALIVAIGYTVLTLGMGYVRQGVALGFSLWAITALIDKKFIKFFILIVLAVGFHKSAVLMLGFGLFVGGRNKYLKIVAAVFMGVGVYMTFMSGQEEKLVQQYIETDLQSKGAVIRVFMNAFPALVFILYRKSWKKFWPDSYTLWYLMSLGAIATVPMVFIFATATDRASLYFIPLQFAVFSHLPLMWRGKVDPILTTSLVVIYYALVHFVWLGFAQWAFAWIPYQNILVEWLGLGTLTHGFR